MKNNLKQTFRILIDYILIHILQIGISILVSYLLYYIEYGKPETPMQILKTIILNVTGLISLLTLYLFYPLIWIALFWKIITKYTLNRIFIFSISSFLIGLILTKLFIGFELFFDFKYGAFPYIAGFLLSPLIYLSIKNYWQQRV